MKESSETLFDTSKPPDDELPVVFLDRTMGSAKIVAHLRAFKEWRVEPHGSHFAGDCPDTEWIRECAKRGWILISGDKEIRRSPENRKAVEKSGAKLFYVNAKNKRAEDYMGILGMARHRILRMAKKNRGPFFASIDGFAGVRMVGREGASDSRDRTNRKYNEGAAYASSNSSHGKKHKPRLRRDTVG